MQQLFVRPASYVLKSDAEFLGVHLDKAVNIASFTCDEKSPLVLELCGFVRSVHRSLRTVRFDVVRGYPGVTGARTGWSVFTKPQDPFWALLDAGQRFRCALHQCEIPRLIASVVKTPTPFRAVFLDPAFARAVGVP